MMPWQAAATFLFPMCSARTSARSAADRGLLDTLQRQEILGARRIQHQPLVVGIGSGQRIQPGFDAFEDRERIGELPAFIEDEGRVHDGAAIVHLIATGIEEGKRLFVGIERLLQFAEVEVGGGLGLDRQSGGGSSPASRKIAGRPSSVALASAYSPRSLRLRARSSRQSAPS
jgi:hypothetical protein